MITFQERVAPKIGLVVDVLLEGRKTGAIYRVVGGWQYQPKGAKHHGEVLPSLAAVKQSLLD